MGEQRNLTEENVEELRTELEKMKVDNPANKKIFEKLESIERHLKMIFDGHVLIGGPFRKVDQISDGD